MQTQNKHTPGPWLSRYITDDQTHATRMAVSTQKGKYCIAYEIGAPSMSAGQIEANARLIAAAPELLEALQRVMEQIADTGTCNQFEGARAMQAISRATSQP